MKKPNRHPWYRMYIHHKEHFLFPWRGFYGFRKWLEREGFDASKGDQIRQKVHRRRGYLIHIVGPDRPPPSPDDWQLLAPDATAIPPKFARDRRDLSRILRKTFSQARIERVRGRVKTRVSLPIGCLRDLFEFSEIDRDEFLAIVYGKDLSVGSLELSEKEEVVTAREMLKREIKSEWYSIKRACLDKKCTAYETVGARGITISDEWKSFKNFRRWVERRLTAMKYKPATSRGFKVVRFDHNIGYCAANCRVVSK